MWIYEIKIAGVDDKEAARRIAQRAASSICAIAGYRLADRLTCREVAGADLLDRAFLFSVPMHPPA